MVKRVNPKVQSRAMTIVAPIAATVRMRMKKSSTLTSTPCQSPTTHVHQVADDRVVLFRTGDEVARVVHFDRRVEALGFNGCATTCSTSARNAALASLPETGVRMSTAMKLPSRCM